MAGHVWQDKCWQDLTVWLGERKAGQDRGRCRVPVRVGAETAKSGTQVRPRRGRTKCAGNGSPHLFQNREGWPFLVPPPVEVPQGRGLGARRGRVVGVASGAGESTPPCEAARVRVGLGHRGVEGWLRGKAEKGMSPGKILQDRRS